MLTITVIALVNVFEPKKQKVTTESNDAFFPASQDTFKQKSSSINSGYILVKPENYLVNWQYILDIVAYNKLFLMNDSTWNLEQYEKIIKSIDKKNMYFSPGNVASLVEQYGDLIKQHCKKGHLA